MNGKELFDDGEPAEKKQKKTSIHSLPH